MKATSDYRVRTYRPEDEPRVLGLLDRTVGPPTGFSWTPEFFRWKHHDSPFGPSFMLVAEAAERIVGLRAFLRWEFVVSGRTYRAVRAVDTATDPDFQGRGVFRRLTLEALDALKNDADFVFNTPNKISLQGYLKMGWCLVSQLPVYVRPAFPLNPVITQPSSGAFRTPRTAEYLRWRYEASPLGYRATYRVRRRGPLREASLSELPTEPLRGTHAHYLLTYCSDAGPLLRRGFVPVPRRVRFAVRPLREGLDPDPTRIESWWLTLGDLEVF